MDTTMIPNHFKIILLFAFSQFLGFAVFGQPITLKNWISHPKIKEIRAIVQDAKSGVAKGRYLIKENSKDIEACKKFFCMLYKYEIKDSSGKVISCGWRFRQSFNLVSTREYYFDRSGIARFSFVTEGSHNTKIKRQYWDEKGVLIWMIEEKKNGPLEYGEDFQVIDNIITSGRACSGYQWPNENN